MASASTGPQAPYGRREMGGREQELFDFGKSKRRNPGNDCCLEWITWWNVAANVLTRKGKTRTQQPASNKNVKDIVCDLKSCAKKRDLKEGRRVHRYAVETGNDTNMFVAAALIRMYADCSSMVDAQRVFDGIKEPDVVSLWNALILGYADSGMGEIALTFFSRLETERRCAPDSVTYVAAIRACTSLAVHEDGSREKKGLKQGRVIHLEIGCHMNHFLQNTLVDMYCKCGSMIEARCVFVSIEEPDVVSWTTLILGYVENGMGQAALDIFYRMKTVGRCAPNSVTYIGVLKACTSLVVEYGKAECLKRGKEIHLEIGSHLSHFVQSLLVDMYSKCGSMSDARRVFYIIRNPDVVSWNALILGYAENGDGQAALDLFSRMKTVPGCIPNSVTYLAAIKACTAVLHVDSSKKGECLERGRKLHLEIGCYISHSMQNTLVDMYSKFGSLVDAQRVFDSIKKPDVVSWTALILGYAENGEYQDALDIFFRMKNVCGCSPNSVAYIAALKGFTSLALHGNEAEKEHCLKRGRELHQEIGCHLNHSVQNALVDMYSKCGSMVDAKRVFDGIKDPNVVSWTSLILGYAENGEGQVALGFFSRMKTFRGCAPNSVTYIAALKACGSIGALSIGRKLHSELLDINVHVVTCLVDFYTKCGSMVEAREVFDSNSNARNITTWNELLAGYGGFGDIQSVFNLFKAMQDDGVRPDVVTFVCILSCCSHTGLVEKAGECLAAMPVQYGITPSVVHYNCMVDCLGRANKLDEAVALLGKMPCNPNAVSWMALLGACRKWKNVEIGRLAFQSLVDLNDERNATAYVLMAQIYGGRGMWEEQERVLETRRKFCPWKPPVQARVTEERVKFVGVEEDLPEIKDKFVKGLKEQENDYDGELYEKEEAFC